MWWIYALLSALFAALTAIFAKKGIQHMDSDLATAIRTCLILFLTWGIVIAKGNLSTISGLKWNNWLFLILSGLATGLSWLFYFRALQIGKVSQVAPIDKTSVAIAILLSFFFLHEKIGWHEILGVTLIISGALVLIF